MASLILSPNCMMDIILEQTNRNSKDTNIDRARSVTPKGTMLEIPSKRHGA